MKLSHLIPVCLISVLIGQLLPAVIENKSLLTLAAAAYLLVLYFVDRLAQRAADRKQNDRAQA
jgi:hypothetical protein